MFAPGQDHDVRQAQTAWPLGGPQLPGVGTIVVVHGRVVRVPARGPIAVLFSDREAFELTGTGSQVVFAAPADGLASRAQDRSVEDAVRNGLSSVLRHRFFERANELMPHSALRVIGLALSRRIVRGLLPIKPVAGILGR